MGQSLSNVLVHFVFGTKGRTPWLQDAWREDFHDYVSATLKKRDAAPIIINSVEDHVHIFLPLPRTCSMADLMKDVKASSSGWIHRKHPERHNFEWQNGYGAFSVSPSHRDSVIEYIKNQKEHHRRVTFQEEFVRLLEVYHITYEEAYLWD